MVGPPGESGLVATEERACCALALAGQIWDSTAGQQAPRHSSALECLRQPQLPPPPDRQVDRRSSSSTHVATASASSVVLFLQACEVEQPSLRSAFFKQAFSRQPNTSLFPRHSQSSVLLSFRHLTTSPVPLNLSNFRHVRRELAIRSSGHQSLLSPGSGLSVDAVLPLCDTWGGGDSVKGCMECPHSGSDARGQQLPRHWYRVDDPSMHSHSVLPAALRHAITSGACRMHVLNIVPKLSSLQSACAAGSIAGTVAVPEAIGGASCPSEHVSMSRSKT